MKTVNSRTRTAYHGRKLRKHGRTYVEERSKFAKVAMESDLILRHSNCNSATGDWSQKPRAMSGEIAFEERLNNHARNTLIVKRNVGSADVREWLDSARSI